MVGSRVVAIVAGYAVLAAPLLANAQCKADVDCKGDRVCEQGRCVDPKTMQPDPPPPAEAPPPETPPPPASDDGVKVTISDSGDAPIEAYTTGWAMPAAIIGFAGAAAVLGLSIGSALTLEDEFGFRESIPAVPLAVSALVATAAIGPIVFAGSGSARRGAGATGLPGLRITGWVLYGVSLLIAVNLILFNLSDIFEIPGWPIIVDGVIGAAALSMFSIDALVAHGEASEGAISEAPSILPTLVFAKESDGSSVPTLGMHARF